MTFHTRLQRAWASSFFWLDRRATHITDQARTADVPRRVFDLGRPIDIDLALTDMQVFLDYAGPFFCLAKRL